MDWSGSHGGLPANSPYPSNLPSILWSHIIVNGTRLFSKEAFQPLKGRPTINEKTWKWWLDSTGTKCVCVCVHPCWEGCLHLNWLHSQRLGGLVVFNVTIAGQSDLFRVVQHHSPNPPPPAPQWLFKFYISFPVKGGSDYPSPQHAVKQPSHQSRNVLRVFSSYEVYDVCWFFLFLGGGTDNYTLRTNSH